MGRGRAFRGGGYVNPSTYVDGLLLETNSIGSVSDWNAHDALVGAYEPQRRYADARREFERALALDPGNAGVAAGLERLKKASAGRP